MYKNREFGATSSGIEVGEALLKTNGIAIKVLLIL
jgi:hypothetical protein